MIPQFRNANTVLARLERGANYAGYFIGFATGPVRVIAGEVEIVAGIALAVGGLAAFLFSNGKKEYCDGLALLGLGYVAHGMGNVLRGALETVNLLGGVLFLLAYDLSGCRFHYYTEQIRSDEFTLNVFHKDAERKSVFA